MYRAAQLTMPGTLVVVTLVPGAPQQPAPFLVSIGDIHVPGITR